MGPLHLSMERIACFITVKYPTGESEEIRLHWLDQAFGEPAPILYKKCTGLR